MNRAEIMPIIVFAFHAKLLIKRQLAIIRFGGVMGYVISKWGFLVGTRCNRDLTSTSNHRDVPREATYSYQLSHCTDSDENNRQSASSS